MIWKNKPVIFERFPSRDWNKKKREFERGGAGQTFFYTLGRCFLVLYFDGVNQYYLIPELRQ
jgi:hypothetical protein